MEAVGDPQDERMVQVSLTYEDGEGERQALARNNSDLRSENLALRQEVERLRAAGDKVAHTLSVQSEWTCCADGWFGPCGRPPDVAKRPTDDSVATALAAWEEARRG